MSNKTAHLVNIGLGMTLGAHISPLSKTYLQQADIVFVLASNSLIEQWVNSLNPNTVSLQKYYQQGKSRLQSYRQMIAAMLEPLRAGKSVCGAFYGHPGVFALVPHQSIEQAKAEGFKAHMEPGISAEDCLYADLAIDPGKYGCAHYEASQFLFKHTVYDPSAYLILWQIDVAGDHSMKVFKSETEQKQQLVNLLLENYPPNHQVILYESAVLPIELPKIEPIMLKNLAHAPMSMKTTLVIPPSQPKTDRQLRTNEKNTAKP